MDRRALAVLLVVLAATPAAADDKKAKQARAGIPAPAAVVTDSYDELFIRYLESARTTSTTAGPNFTWMAGLNADQRARNVNDLVTVQVLESIVGTGTADSSLDKEGKAAAGVTQLFGAEAAMPSWLDPTNLVGAASKTDFKGGGSTTRTGTLTAVLTARVTEVLPNGDLVLEGAREIDINGDRQIVVLTGVVRTSSILQGNVVPSPAIGQLRIRYFGRGLIKDNLQPGWLIRVLNKVF
jgi:flagellar L-ring protein precursor FlgH